jgi:putative transcriptional regulator
MGTDDEFDGLLSRLTEILANPEGQPSPERLPVRSDRLRLLDRIDVAAIRARTGLSQAALASRTRVYATTLRSWENGNRGPKGPARALLALLSHNPRILEGPSQADGRAASALQSCDGRKHLVG